MTDDTRDETRKFAVEEVDAAPSPPRARVDDAPADDAPQVYETPTQKFARKRDYLEGFLAQEPEGEDPTGPGGMIYEGVISALKEIYDPEIPVNIYELGLI